MKACAPTASGSVALYARGGQCQFVVKRLRAQGVGVLYERLQMLKEKLGREGLFAPERKRALPPLPGYRSAWFPRRRAR